ncbi:hypothetical protein, partial [Mesorhizobium silamurunense]|uniref:hypothetical protein n=2 Tax=Mesorhizobium silamurunense TaxID=499528 RepID=UPI001AEE4B44
VTHLSGMNCHPSLGKGIQTLSNLTALRTSDHVAFVSRQAPNSAFSAAADGSPERVCVAKFIITAETMVEIALEPGRQEARRIMGPHAGVN